MQPETGEKGFQVFWGFPRAFAENLSVSKLRMYCFLS